MKITSSDLPGPLLERGDPRARLHLAMKIEDGRMRPHPRLLAERLAGDQPRPQAVFLDHRQVARSMMPEAWLSLLLLLGQRDPGLDAVHRSALGARFLEPLRMGDAAPGRHPIDLARPDRLLRPHAITVHDLAVEQIGDGRKADVRMRPHIDGARDARRELHRPHMIEEDERADHPPLRPGQHAPYLETAEVLASLVDDEVDHDWLPLSGANKEPRRQVPVCRAPSS